MLIVDIMQIMNFFVGHASFFTETLEYERPFSFVFHIIVAHLALTSNDPLLIDVNIK